MAQHPHIAKALEQIGREIQAVWVKRAPRRSGKYKQALRDSRNVVATPKTVTVGKWARSQVHHAQFVEDGHRAFSLPNRIQRWNISKKGTQYKRLAWTDESGRRVVRTITPKSRGWRIPAMEGLHGAETIPRELRPMIIEKLKEAARKDGIEIIRNAIKTAAGNNRFVKITVR